MSAPDESARDDATLDDAALDKLRRIGDPEADTVVAKYFGTVGASAGELFAAIVRHPDDPDAGRQGPIADYYAQRPPWPPWARSDLIRHGQRYFERWGPQILSSLLLASLPDAYAAAKGVQVLRLTARLATDTQRRLIETTQMVVDTMTVGGIDVGAVGYRTIRQIRLMHAAIRYLIAHDPFVKHTCDEATPSRWCDQWGLPINQEDLLGTLLTFTVVTFEALERSGVAVTRADADAYLHTWNVVGHLLGIRPDLLPLDYDTAVALRGDIRRRQYAPSAAGQEMTAALMSLAAAQTRPRLLSGMPRTTTRYLIGDDVCDLLGVPSADWTRVLFAPARRVLRALALGERHDWLMRTVTARLNRWIIEEFLRTERAGDRPRFALPRHLADAWSIPGAAAASPGAAASGTD